MSDSGWDVVDMVLRNGKRYQAMAENERQAIDERFANFLEELSDDDNDQLYVEDDNDDDVSYRPEDASDVEADAHVEISDDLDEDGEDEEEAEYAAARNRDADNNSCIISKNGTKWDTIPPPSSRIRAHNVVDFRRKPGPVTKIHDPINQLITADIAYIILRETNRKANQEILALNSENPRNQKEWKPITLKEFNAFVGIVLHAGLSKSNNEPAVELWGKTRDPLYKAALSVGTVRSNKPYIPQEFLKKSTRPVCSSLFGFYEGDVFICAKKNKAVLLLSTVHYTCEVDNVSEKRKPNAILDYNANKSGVDTMDQMLGTYSCKRSTTRWPLAMFYNMLDIAALAAFVIYNEISPSQKNDKRRSFLKLLTRQLVTPNIEERATNVNITRFPNIRNVMEAFDVQVVARTVPVDETEFAPRSNRPSCQLCLEKCKRRRKTRSYCSSCKKAVCAEHSKTFYRCESCNTELYESRVTI